MPNADTHPEPLTEALHQNHAAASCVPGSTAVSPGVMPAIPAANVEQPKTDAGPGIPQPDAEASNQKEAAPSVKSDERVPWAFVVNLVLLIAGGTWLCVWLLHYTDKFDDFAKLLALGGGLTWVAFVLKLLSEERLKALQRAADRFVFSNWLLTVLLLIAGIVGYWYRAHSGTLQVELFLGTEDRILTVKGGGASGDPRHLAPGDRARVLAWTSQEKPAILYIKVSGYPDLRVNIAPHERRDLRIPTSFMRRVLLLKPTPKLIAHRTDSLRVSVKLGGQIRHDIPFDGSPIWIGADEDVFVPHSMLERWHDSLPEDVRSDVMSYLQHPRALTASGFDLNPGDHVCVEFLRKGGSTYSRREITVRALEPNQDFPQEEEIDARSDENSPDPPSC